MRESLYSKILDYLENIYGNTLLNLILQNNIQSVDYKYYLKQFAESLSQHSLSFSFQEAKESRKKGNINRAMLVVSELVRDHVTALRKIQHIFDKINGADPREVIFQKFRQFDPLEVGLENAPDVLRIIDIFINSWIKNNHELRVQYLDLEIQVDTEQKKSEVSNLNPKERIQYQIELINPIFTIIFSDIITRASDSVKVER